VGGGIILYWVFASCGAMRTTQAADYMVLLPCLPSDMPHLDAEGSL
jgi:hypothetical protein